MFQALIAWSKDGAGKLILKGTMVDKHSHQKFTLQEESSVV